MIGYCECGCGGRTAIATRTRPEHGHVKGVHFRFIRFHGQRGKRGVPDGTMFDECDMQLAESYHWHRRESGYICRDAKMDGKRRTVFFHRAVVGDPPRGFDVDHINGDRSDNRRCNLRIITHAENGQNRTKLDARNKSGYRGVVYRRDFDKYVAYGAINRRYVHLGSYSDVLEAARVAREFRLANYPGTIEPEIPVVRGVPT